MVAPAAKIIPIRILDQDGMGDIWRLANALIFAANPDGDNATDDGADIINLSLGTTQQAPLIRKILDAITNDGRNSDDPDLPMIVHPGILVVASAGNTGNNTRIYPAAENDLHGLIAVGASTAADTVASFSTRGSWVELMAPGERIVSSVPGGRYGVWRGTSMAAPVVAGISALVRSRFSSMSPNAVFEHLRSTAATCNGAITRRVDAGEAVTNNP
ncbi:MAG: S8 family serine peptidase [Chloracidobacterium sp.]|nr:S8 family serine peptidase [Chloracidobacterium sp.]